jgi:hypoxanthine-guanine phosphoribosyltransferase
VSQHINEPNTNRGDDVHIFNCTGEYIYGTGTDEKKETRNLRIVAVT